jgi:hypothetical protein
MKRLQETKSILSQMQHGERATLLVTLKLQIHLAMSANLLGDFTSGIKIAESGLADSISANSLRYQVEFSGLRLMCQTRLESGKFDGASTEWKMNFEHHQVSFFVEKL